MSAQQAAELIPSFIKDVTCAMIASGKYNDWNFVEISQEAACMVHHIINESIKFKYNAPDKQ